PATVAELRPVVVVLRLAADIDHAVDRARPAQHFSARHFYATPTRTLVGLGREAPVDGRQVDHLGNADGNARPEVVRALGARLEQQHAVRAALAEAARDGGAGRARADDDVVIGGHGRTNLTHRLPPWQGRPRARNRREEGWGR